MRRSRNETTGVQAVAKVTESILEHQDPSSLLFRVRKFNTPSTRYHDDNKASHCLKHTKSLPCTLLL